MSGSNCEMDILIYLVTSIGLVTSHGCVRLSYLEHNQYYKLF